MAEFSTKQFNFPTNGKTLIQMLVLSIVIGVMAIYAMSTFTTLQTKAANSMPPSAPPTPALNAYAGSSTILGLGLAMFLFVLYVFFRGRQ